MIRHIKFSRLAACGLLLACLVPFVASAQENLSLVVTAGTAERVRPDVVLMDIGLPVLNGYEACRRIRDQAWGAPIVMIALTGWGQEEDRELSQSAGFDLHLVKPVDHDRLLQVVGSARPRASA